MKPSPITTRRKPANSVCVRVSRTLPIAAAPGPRRHEDDGEAERRRAGSRARPRRAPPRARRTACASTARHGRQVAGDERQHARRDDRRSGPRRTRPAELTPSKRASSSSSRRSSSGSIGGHPRRRRRPRQRDQRQASQPERAPPPSPSARNGSTHASRLNPCFDGSARIAGPELGDELPLDLALRVAGGDPRRDELPDPVRDRRGRLIERRLAGRAHHLALELRRGVGCRSLASAGAQRAEREQQRRGAASRLRARAGSRRSACRRADLAADPLADERARRGRRSTVSGKPVTPYFGSTSPGPSCDVRVREPVACA